MKAIPTLYKGRQYRSQLEARWACFFDLVGWKYEYEPYPLNGWIPDFILIAETGEILVEVKPFTSLEEFDTRRLIVAMRGTEKESWVSARVGAVHQQNSRVCTVADAGTSPNTRACCASGTRRATPCGGTVVKTRRFFTFASLSDLFHKLERDLSKLETNPLDVDLAFNFFITAEHLLDWKYPRERAKRTAERKSSTVLQIVSHLASGAKHFEVPDPRHKSIDRTEKISHSRVWGEGYWGDGYWGGHEALAAALDGDAKAKFGQWIEVIPLARPVVEYWRRNLKP